MLVLARGPQLSFSFGRPMKKIWAPLLYTMHLLLITPLSSDSIQPLAVSTVGAALLVEAVAVEMVTMAG